MRFRAAVLDRVNTPLSIDTLEMAPLQPGDVLVRLHATGLCHTDLEVIQGSLAYPMPIVLGHEGAGVVEKVGSAVSTVKAGDHVICSWNPHCGHCFYCERSLPILCEPFRAHQPKGRLLDGSGEDRADAAVLEREQPGDGATCRGGDLVLQRGGMHSRLQDHPRRALEHLRGDLHRHVPTEAHHHPTFCERLDDEVGERWPAAV